MNKILLLTMGLLSNAALAADPCAADKAQFPEVSREELASLISKKQAVVIDVNSKESYDELHVPGAIHFASTEAKFAGVLPKTKGDLVVAYCGGPKCTAWKRAAEAACKLGYTQIKHYKGGISGWKKGLSG